MGVKDVTLSGITESLDGSWSLYGENFTRWSRVYINDERQDSTFLNNTRIELSESTLENGDIITVKQVGSSNTIFRVSAQYVYQDGALSVYTGDDTGGSTGENTDGSTGDGENQEEEITSWLDLQE